MKKVLGFGILAALAVFGCQVEEEGELAPEGKVFMATQKRTSLTALKPRHQWMPTVTCFGNGEIK